MGVLGAPRGGLERSGRDFWRLKSAQDAIFGVLGAPRGDLDASGWDFGAFWRLREAKNVAFWRAPRGQRPGGMGRSLFEYMHIYIYIYIWPNFFWNT